MLEVKENISFVNNKLDGISFNKHFHEEYSIGLILDGEHCFSACGNTYNINRGIIRNINPYELHTTFESSWSYVNLMPTIELMNSIALEMSFNPLPSGFIPFTPTIFDEVAVSLFKNAYYQLNSKGDPFALESSVIELFSYMIKHYSSYNVDTVIHHNKVSKNIHRALDYMNACYLDSDISLDEVACIAALNKYYFIREFKRHYGMTPIYYLNIKRINKAKEMMMDNIPLTEITYACGFSDQAYFTNVFRKFFGYSPTKLGKRHIQLNLA